MQTQVQPDNRIRPSVHKFGGSSLASASRFAAVADIILAQDLHKSGWVVVSAPGDTTDALLKLIACNTETERNAECQVLQQQLSGLINETLQPDAAAQVCAILAGWLNEASQAVGRQQPNDVLAIGERLSALLLSELLKQRRVHAVALDARDFLTLRQHQPDWPRSQTQLRAKLQPEAIHIVTGYIARDEQGRSITLGRNGSDYSATLLAALLDAEDVTIWTDVKAIYSADPRKVTSAVPYRQVSQQQACVLASLGNPVLHARTLSPLAGTDISLKVCSSFEPAGQGCKVTERAQAQGFITELADVTLLTLHPDAAASSASLALQLQQPVIALPRHGENLCWLLPAACAEVALNWLAERNIHAVWDTQRYHALAWLKAQPAQDAGPVQSLLAQSGVLHHYENDELCIWLLASQPAADCLTQIHQLLISTTPALQVVVAGTGNVGGEFLSMLHQQKQRLAGRLNLQLAGVLNSRQALLTTELDATQWQAQLLQAPGWQSSELIAYLTALPSPKVVVDITPSSDFALLYADFAAAGCDIISANKQGVTLPGAKYNFILQALAQHQRQWLSNTTCGAGIPVQRTLRELRDAGDHIKEVSGIFSGTLSWLFCRYDGSKPFSDFVLQAQQAGLTEPDPRDDLSGKDVQRKLLVLARELGLSLELDDIGLEPLLPAGLERGDWQQFWQQRQQLDDHMAALFEQATKAQKILRYVAALTLHEGEIQARVSLQAVAKDHALAAIAACDNVFVIRSNWYCDNPLVLKGPGAGKVVTAGGLHADLAILINQISAAASAPVLL